MYERWSFFRAVVDNAQLDVAKADMGIAELYSSLVDNAELGNLFERIRSEHQLTRRMLCEITRQRELLDNMPAIKYSIERRNPCVDPLNFIQVELLRRLRTLPSESAEYQSALEAALSTINGVAAGMKPPG